MRKYLKTRKKFGANHGIYEMRFQKKFFCLIHKINSQTYKNEIRH